MKALIFSDSHGSTSNMISAIESEKPDLVIHAGDVVGDVDELKLIYPHLSFEYVVGNNDFWVPNVTENRFFDWCGKKIFVTHGHKFGVRGSTAKLLAYAKQIGADICVYGHTHVRELTNTDGIWIVNPGARYSYAKLLIENRKIDISLNEI